MTLEEAIKILTPDSEEHFEASVQKLEEAEKLGIEALKELKVARAHWPGWFKDCLPGETEED